MAAGLPDLVDCTRLAEESAVLRRVYELGALPSLHDLLAEPRGMLNAYFAFAKMPSGRPGVQVTVEATPLLICQRCLKGFGWPVTAASEVEFVAVDEPGAGEPAAAEAEREFFAAENGRASLQALAEEELLLALPLAPACSTPLTCGQAPAYASGEVDSGAMAGTRRPFGALQDLLKKT